MFCRAAAHYLGYSRGILVVEPWLPSPHAACLGCACSTSRTAPLAGWPGHQRNCRGLGPGGPHGTLPDQPLAALGGRGAHPGLWALRPSREPKPKTALRDRRATAPQPSPLGCGTDSRRLARGGATAAVACGTDLATLVPPSGCGAGAGRSPTPSTPAACPTTACHLANGCHRGGENANGPTDLLVAYQ